MQLDLFSSVVSAYVQAGQELSNEHGFIRHGASMPISLPKFLIEFLTEEGDLVVDPMAGRMKVGMAAESLGRRWICTDKIFDYVCGSEVCFQQ